ncbi:hypothetical protein WPS_06500 [Vulcanimicrobium alpinum]|uniref:Uncharacterized protein n=2 Tax=Vulcanimicrobium alpinum TaxID=3016050 RepID=A0AAN1XTL6_UNVUL|nr:hypothetical protein WPS_06500 [Vulcanimicrobium alpinum]
MRRLGIALPPVAAILVAAAPHHAPHAAQAGHGAARSAVVGVSGSPQNAHAYAAAGAAAYETDFPQPLVARIAGGDGAAPKVRFRCEQPDCKLYILDAPSDFERSDPRTFTIGASDRKVSARVSITAPRLGTYTVSVALADAKGGSRADAAVYSLTVR